MGKPVKFLKKFMLRRGAHKRSGRAPVKVADPLREFTQVREEDEGRGGRGGGGGGCGGRAACGGGGARRGGARRGHHARALPRRKQVNIYVRATFNNTFFALGSIQGDILAWCSSGSCGYRGKKKKTPYAAQKALGRLLRQLKVLRYVGVAIVINGVGRGRRGVARSVRRYGFRILRIVDKTGVAHNGCRLRKKRRRRFMLTK